MLGKVSLIGLLAFLASASLAQAASPVMLGRLQTGATVEFVENAAGAWGISIRGGTGPGLFQNEPARVEVFQNGRDIRELAAGYATVSKSASGVEGRTDIAEDGRVLFHVDDLWLIDGAVLTLQRRVEILRNAPGGFLSSIQLDIDPKIGWSDVAFLAPGVIYGDPSHDGATSPGGTLNYAAHRLMLREDILPAPLFALSFQNGASLAMLDPSPRGDTTLADTTLARPVLIDARFTFGAMGAEQTDDGPIAVGFRFPGTAQMYLRGLPAPQQPQWVRRYHPIVSGRMDHYTLSFRFGQNESFRDMTRNAWRWTWETLKPEVLPLDVDLVRRVLVDRLEANAATIDGRTGMPFVLNTISDRLQWNWTMIAMGFVGKDLSCANQLLLESDRDSSQRGHGMRHTGLAIIDTMIKALPTVPPEASGFDLRTGKPWQGRESVWLAPWLRNMSEGRDVVLQAYRRERAHGHVHPSWLRWVKTYTDWLIRQQRPDGSFPRRWAAGSDTPAEPSGTASYAPVPLLTLMTRETRDPEYLQAAIRAGDYVWKSWGTRGLFVGGASDNPDITDKEAGMLSLEAFLDLYDSTQDKRWLGRAQTAGNYAESWIWIWNLPMPLDATNARLDWKKGVPTVGLQGITASAAGGADEYLDWAVPDYARLYNDTGDAHYLSVARVLLDDTKSMVSLPGRLYDMKGPGWQQEHWNMGPGGSGRGSASHRLWLPWVTANHLDGITGLEAYDPRLFKGLTAEPARGGR